MKFRNVFVGNVFVLLSLMFSIVLFILYRSPVLLYFGLPYSLIVYVRHVKIGRPNKLAPLGVLMILASPYFLLHSFGGYPSPLTFQSFVIIGFTLVFLDLREVLVPTVFMALAPVFALLVRFGVVSSFVSSASSVFVDVTSVMVRHLLDIVGYPIQVYGNVITVRNSMVVVGSGCSGLSALVLYFLATVLLVYVRRSALREAMLLFAGLLGIIPLNALRIFILLVVGYKYGLPYLRVFHSHIGDLMFIVYVYLYWWVVLKKLKG